MPGFNQQGPTGQGSMTGRRMGKCTNYDAAQKSQIADEGTQSNDLDRGFGLGQRGLGRGRGRGCGRGFGMQNRFRSGS